MLDIVSKKTVLRFAVVLLAAGILPSPGYAAVYISPAEFVSNSFDQPPAPKSYWLKAEHQAAAKGILGHPYRGLRLRYWQLGETTAWIMDEIGKEKPITVGIVIDGNSIRNVSILEFRESRGGEVRHPFFTRQFAGLFLKENKELNHQVDGIAGATLSVRAVSNVSRYALFLHRTLLESQNQYAHQDAQ